MVIEGTLDLVGTLYPVSLKGTGSFEGPNDGLKTKVIDILPSSCRCWIIWSRDIAVVPKDMLLREVHVEVPTESECANPLINTIILVVQLMPHVYVG